ncbi:hypothetical protein [Shimia sp. FJ5]|uniref:hypothetical protein n=1 Tax=Shimia sp. FJ5 TaxID=3079054 RepID=UPI00293DFB7D|nr:hypothetical protein [Shimia sp. FJ5]MDV4146722.1 hypothetical protein [Shimia sp. FJ5]
MNIANSLVVAAALAILPLPIFAKELTGSALVEALSGRSFSCDAEGKPMTITFGKAKKNGSVNYRGKLNGRSFSSSYKMDKSGRYRNGGRLREVHRTGKGKVTILSKDLPTAVCTVK